MVAIQSFDERLFRINAVTADGAAMRDAPNSAAETNTPIVVLVTNGAAAPQTFIASTSAIGRPPLIEENARPQKNPAATLAVPSITQNAEMIVESKFSARRNATMNVMYAIYPAPNSV
jgi:hypothetical protein